MSNSFWKGYHYAALARAVARGPRYFLGYAIRRAGRRALWKATRNLR